MATSKTLTPTNVTISIPEFTDKPDQRVNTNCIDKEADAINALSYQIGTLKFKFVSVSLGSVTGGTEMQISMSNFSPSISGTLKAFIIADVDGSSVHDSKATCCVTGGNTVRLVPVTTQNNTTLTGVAIYT